MADNLQMFHIQQTVKQTCSIVFAILLSDVTIVCLIKDLILALLLRDNNTLIFYLPEKKQMTQKQKGQIHNPVCQQNLEQY